MTVDAPTATTLAPRPWDAKTPGQNKSFALRYGLRNGFSCRRFPAVSLLLGLLCILTVLLAGCKSQQGGQASGPNAAATDEQGLPTRVPADFRLTLERTACYGTCPIYELSIDSSGRADLQAGRFMELDPGNYRKQLADSTLLTLYRRLERDSIWAFEEVYDANISDVPSMILEVRAGERQHRTKARADYPDRIAKLFTFLEERIGVKDTARWAPVEDD